MIPTLQSVVTFDNPENPAAQQRVKVARAASRQLKLEIIEHAVASVEELRASLGALPSGNRDAYFYIADAMIGSQTDLIIEATKAKRLPAIFSNKGAAMRGALATYGESFYALGRATAKPVKQVLLGR